MTDALKMAREALKPCPHCGLAHTLKLTTAQELAEEGEDDPEPWMHSDSWAVVMCDASRPSGPGGCGASGGFYPSEAEAVEAWNRRAAIDAQQAAPTVTGGSPEHLLQDQDRGLSQWLASKPDARLRVREACADIAAQQAATVGAPLDSPEVTALWQQFCRTAAYRHALQWVKDDEVPGALFTAFRAGLNATPPAVQAAPVALTEDAIFAAAEDIDNESAWIAGFYQGAKFAEAQHGIGAAAQGGE